MKHLYIFVLAITLAACKQEHVAETTQSNHIKSVRVEHIVSSAESQPILTSGRVEADETLTLSFKTGGIIAQVFVNEGQKVSAGQELARLNLSEINARVHQAQTQVNKLEADLVKYRSLAKDSAIAPQVVADMETALDVAQSDLEIAIYNQTHSVITAPSGGIILKKMALSGEMINPGTPVLTLASTSQSRNMVLSTQLTDQEVVLLQTGDKAEVSFDAYPNAVATATVSEIAGQAHPRTGTFEVKLTINHFDWPLKSGFFAKARIYPSAVTHQLRLPMISLVEGNKESVKIYTAHENVVQVVTARPLYIGHDFFTIAATSGSSLDVITEGSAYVAEGESINILN